ncbi:MAG TPA: ABC transporter permease [Candidatus Olsenella avicola]|nr:ABC transporter permease [Candidatus Olsenella avicola]
MNKKNPVVSFFTSREGILAIFVAIFFGVLVATSNLGQDMFSFLKDVSYMIVGGLALMLVVMLGEIDISAGTVLGLIGFFTGNLLKMGVPIPLVILVGMLVGMVNSAIIGFINVKFHVPTMVVSLAMVKLHLGIFPLLPNAGWVSNIPMEISNVGNAKIGVVPVMLFFSLAILVFFMWFMKYTRFGKTIYAVGGSKPSATLAGIKNGKVVFLTFVMSGALLGITSIMYWLPASQVQPSGTNGLEMYFIPIAVVAGVSILGGTGRPIGILISTFLIAMLQRACILWGLGNAWLYLTYGVVVLIAVYSSVTDFAALFGGRKKKGANLEGGAN